MNKENRKDRLEGIGIVASLNFVGPQKRQAQKMLRANSVYIQALRIKIKF
jgi:hypothetical protein